MSPNNYGGMPTDFNALMAPYCQKYYDKGYDAGYEKAKEEDHDEIEMLRRKLAMYENTNTTMVVQAETVATSTQKDFNYNFADFPRINGDAVIRAIIKLGNAKISNNRYIITQKTSWCIVKLLLCYYGLYAGSNDNFTQMIRECVIPHLDRRFGKNNNELDIAPKSANFSTFDYTEIKAPEQWRNKHKRKKEGEYIVTDKEKGQRLQERAINIRCALEKYLSAEGIKSSRFENLQPNA